MNVMKMSKKLSYVLRHHPDAVGITLDDAGWVGIDVLLAALAAHGTPITREQLMRVVEENDKKRFAVDGDLIRASQGHSVDVDLGYQSSAPPQVLFHGTASRNLESIMSAGLRPQNRHHVHLSADVATARTVGSRHGRPVVLSVAADAMVRAGHEFYLSANGVWLTAQVPVGHLAVAVS